MEVSGNELADYFQTGNGVEQVNCTNNTPKKPNEALTGTRISIIVPVYNVAPYLDECMESIVGQTYTNLEIILVDDGSTDESGTICDVWATRDNRVTVLHKANGGQSSARNRGLQVASGDYIGYVDSDDYIDSAMYETLIQLIEEEQADVAGCQFKSCNNSKTSQIEYKEQLYTYTGRDVCNKMIETPRTEPKINFSVCNWLYKDEIAKTALFEEGVYYEDVMYPFDVLWNISKVVFYDKPMYFYRERNESTTHLELTCKHVKDTINYILKLYEFYLKEGNDEEISMIRRHILDYILRFRRRLPSKLKTEYSNITHLIKDYDLHYTDLKQQGFKCRLRYVVTRYFDRPYIKIRKWLHQIDRKKEQ